MQLKPLAHLIYGIATFIPGVNSIRLKGPGDTDSARYCYSVWMRHIVLAKQNGLNTHPKVIAELGPGDSLGIGICGLLAGAETYHAFDVVEHANTTVNLTVFEELVELFSNQSPIPDDREFPNLQPPLKSYEFPIDIYPEEHIRKALTKTRIKDIEHSIRNIGAANSRIMYTAPLSSQEVSTNVRFDLIYSQAVLEHVDRLNETFAMMRIALSHQGFVSHQIDLTSHNVASSWDGHWQYSDWVWYLFRGKRPYLINREPYTTYEKLFSDNDFDIIFENKFQLTAELPKNKLAKKFHSLERDERTVSGLFIQATPRIQLK